MDFQKSLQEKLEEHDPTEVDELILDDLFTDIEAFTSEHKRTLELYNNLVHLSLNGLGLKSLKNFPKIPCLQVLELRNNHLTGSDFADLKSYFPTLYKLKVGDNPIRNLDVFNCFSSFPNLKKLELEGTDPAKNDTYRSDMFKLLKNVEIIDRLNRDGDEVESTIYDDEDGEFEDDEGEDGEDMDEDLGDEEEEDFDDEDDEEEPPKKKKARKE
jgi:hypothetical protein